MPSKASTDNQPQGLAEMTVMGKGQVEANEEQRQCEHGNGNKALRLRGGGAGKNCLIAVVGCFFCFECCEGCCDIIGDIICCPCELFC